MIRFSGHSSCAEPIPLRTRCFASGAGAVGEADDREAGDAGVDVRLDLDPARLEPDERVGDGAREHATDATPALSRPKAHDSATDQDRLVVLARAPARPAVDVPLEPLVEPQAGPLEDLRVERRAGR